VRNRELILSLSNGILELYPHILSLYLDIVVLSLTNIDGNFHCDKESWWISQSNNFIFAQW
jgi:hypothetical protein